MHASDYLRMKLQSDRHLAMSVQNGFRGVIQTAKGVASDIYAGIERASWYTSCLIPQYHEVCHELAREEIRMLYSIASVFQHRDVLQHMLYLYFESIFDDIHNGNRSGRVRHLSRNAANLAAQSMTAAGTRYVVAESLALALAHSQFLTESVAKRLSGKLSVSTFALQMFGIEQKAAMAARRLKALAPDYYWMLYSARLEMLYYFIEPVMVDIINTVNMKTFSNSEELSEELRRKFNV